MLFFNLHCTLTIVSFLTIDQTNIALATPLKCRLYISHSYICQGKQRKPPKDIIQGCKLVSCPRCFCFPTFSTQHEWEESHLQSWEVAPPQHPFFKEWINNLLISYGQYSLTCCMLGRDLSIIAVPSSPIALVDLYPFNVWWHYALTLFYSRWTLFSIWCDNMVILSAYQRPNYGVWYSFSWCWLD